MKRTIPFRGMLCFFCMISFFGFAQTNWIKYPDNPIMSPGAPGSFNAGGYAFVTILTNNDTLNMWYTASDQSHQKIGLAQSLNGYEFTFCDDVPFFEGSSVPESFDSEGVFNPQILQINDTTWYMWYGGLDYTNFNSEIGLANSTDGIHWQRYSSDPVLERGTGSDFDALLVYPGTVFYDDSIFRMWYTGMNNSYQYRLGYATSPDGIVWEKYENNPLWEYTAANPKVMKLQDGYQMWYNEPYANKMYISYGLSEDGVAWRCSNAPVLFPGQFGEFDDEGVTAPSVVAGSSGLYRLWYTAWSGSDNTYSVGYAIDSTQVNTKTYKLENLFLSIYPNPVRNESQITYTLDKNSIISLNLYNAMGIKIIELDKGYKTQGKHTLNLERQNLPTGLYICMLTSPNQRAVCKFIII